MEKVIITPQKSDMGSGFGELKFNKGDSLEDFFKFFIDNIKAWGTITISWDDDKKIIRKFDYDLWNNKILYYNINGWVLKAKLKKVTFSYCFMSEDYEIFISVKED